MTTPDGATLAEKAITTQEPNASSTQQRETTGTTKSTEMSTVTTPERVKQSEVVEGGSPNLEIWLDPTAQKLVTERLTNRLQTVNALSSKELPLTSIDRLIQKLGPEAIDRLEKGSLTREDLAIAVFVLRDELLQKSLAAGQLIKDVKKIETTRLGKIPFFRRIVENPSLQTQLASTKPLSTEYTRQIGFDQWTQDRIENDLVALNQLRTSVELSFYGRHLDDPLFDQDSISLYTAGRKTGNRLHDAVVDELMGTEGILTQRFGGKTFLELSQEDPIAATQALFEANQRALTQFAGETARNLLKSEKPEIDSNVIKNHADKLRQEPKPEDVSPLLATKLKISESNFKRADEVFEKAKSQRDKLTRDRSSLASEMEDLQNLSILTSDQQSKKEEIDRKMPEIEKEISDLTGAMPNLENNKFIAQAEEESIRIELQNVINKFLSPEAKIERQERTTALDKWINVARPENYAKIISARFSQTFEDQFTRERLASIDEKDGEIAGAERIREHIFRIVLENKADHDPTLARKMLPDEAITRAIIWVYKLDPSGIITKNDHGTSSVDVKNALPYLRSSQFQTGDLLRFMVHEGLKSAERGEPYLMLDEYFAKPKPELRLEAESIYREGVGRAEEKLNEQGEKGLSWGASIPNPARLPGFARNDLPLYFSFSFIFDKAKASIPYKTYIKMDERFMQSLPRALDASLPLEIKEKLYDATTGLLHSEKIKLNEFIQIQEADFDEENRIIKLLDYLKNNVSEDAPKMLKVSIANYFLERNPAERLESLRGLGGVGIPMKAEGVTTTVKNPDGSWITVAKDYQLDFDNTGNFFLVDPTTNERHELQSFYKRELENFRESKGVQALSKAQREALNDQSFAKIQERLGEAILYGQSV